MSGHAHARCSLLQRQAAREAVNNSLSGTCMRLQKLTCHCLVSAHMALWPSLAVALNPATSAEQH